MHTIQAIRNEDMQQYQSKCTTRLERDHLVEEASQCPSKSTVFNNKAEWDAEITEDDLSLPAEKNNSFCFVLQNFPQSFFDAGVDGNPLTDGRYAGFEDPCIRARALIQDYLMYVSELKTLTDGMS